MVMRNVVLESNKKLGKSDVVYIVGGGSGLIAMVM